MVNINFIQVQTLTNKLVNQVYVIDDDVEVRRSLHFLLSTAGFVSWQFASASDFLDNLPNLDPAPILIDLIMGPISGIELMTILAARGIRWPVIVMTAYADIPSAVQTTKLGAIDFLEKPIEFNQLEASLHTAIAQLSAVKNAAEIQSTSHMLFDSLSSREVKVMMALMEGLSNKAAAHQLSISVRTIEMHRANALLKLNVKSIAEVIRLSSDAGIILTPHR